MPNTNHAVAHLILNDTAPSLPLERRGAVALRRLELQLMPYPALFRQLQDEALTEVRESHPELADQLEDAMASAQQALENHMIGLRAVTNLLNNK